MRLELIQINNFRNLEQVTIRPAAGINLLVGENAQGKTNFLEALYVLAHGTSFRTVRDSDLVSDQKDTYEIKVVYQKEGRSIQSVLNYTAARGKILRINNKRSTFSHPDRLRMVLFTPDDLYIVKGSPHLRRSFLDLILCQVSNKYAQYLNNYSKILKKRNLFLKTAHINQEMESLTRDMLIENAVPLIMGRINLVEWLEKEIHSLYRQITGGNNQIRLRYALSFTINKERASRESVSAALRQALDEKQENEKRRGTTLVGPHRDDLNIYIDDRNARTHASQGEQRSLAVVLKAAEMTTIKNIRGISPIFLLDEVMAELDQTRRTLLLEHLNNTDSQSFLTTVERDIITTKQAGVFNVINGNLFEEA